MILLSPEEIASIKTKQIKPINTFHRQPLIDMQLEAVAKAQLKNVVEWLEGDCPHDVTPQIPYARAKRKDCVECWQALKKEAG